MLLGTREAPAKSALTTAAAELHLTANWTAIAKFDGEFASGAQTYAGTGTLKYSWWGAAQLPRLTHLNVPKERSRNGAVVIDIELLATAKRAGHADDAILVIEERDGDLIRR